MLKKSIREQIIASYHQLDAEDIQICEEDMASYVALLSESDI